MRARPRERPCPHGREQAPTANTREVRGRAPRTSRAKPPPLTPGEKATLPPRLLQELDRVVDDAEPEEASFQIRVWFEEVVELFERSFDLRVGTFDQLLHGTANLVPQDVGELLHSTPSFLLLLDPLHSLLLGLPLPPRLKELGHPRQHRRSTRGLKSLTRLPC